MHIQPSQMSSAVPLVLPRQLANAFRTHPQSPINERRIVRLLLFRDDNARESGSSQPTAGSPVHPSVPRPTFKPLVSENREHLGDSPSFSSDFQTLPPCGHLLPRVFLPAAPLYLLSRGASLRARARARPPAPEMCSTAMVPPQLRPHLFFSSSTVPTLPPNPLIPFQSSR